LGAGRQRERNRRVVETVQHHEARKRGETVGGNGAERAEGEDKGMPFSK
jgi:hypothetical protein